MSKKNVNIFEDKEITREFSKLFMITDNEVLAKKYHVKESTIRMWGSKLRLNKKMWLWSRHDENFVLKNYGIGRYTVEEIAKKLGRTRWSIINKFREQSGKRKPKQAKPA